MEYQSIAQVASMADIPETTARRYVAAYSGYVDSQKYGRVTKYKVPETVSLIRRLFSLYQAGKTSEEIAAILAYEACDRQSFADGYEAAAATTALAEPSPSSPSLSESLLLPYHAEDNQIINLLEAQTRAMEEIAASVASIATTRSQELADIREKQVYLEKFIEERAYFVRVPRAIRRGRASWGGIGAALAIALLAGLLLFLWEQRLAFW